ncbi:MAG: oxidoreductase [Candidatus Ranarchaeia archaeon]
MTEKQGQEAKPKLAMYWGASCGGCEIALLDVDEDILTIAENFDFMFCPGIMDTKYEDIKALPDKSIKVTLYNGGVRTKEQEEMARLLRQKSELLIAFGACSMLGGIPSLANLADRNTVFQVVYKTAVSNVNEQGVVPQVHSKVDEGELELPLFYNSVLTLDQVVEVDYYIPGCPPNRDTIMDAINNIIKGELPEKGSVLSPGKSLCETCPRKRSEKKQITKIHRVSEIVPDKETCFLEQGIFCAGPVTRSGCGHKCINVNMPCRGCYGPVDGTSDQGAKLISTIGSMIVADTSEETNKVLKDLPDPVGFFYRFSLARSRIRRKFLD